MNRCQEISIYNKGEGENNIAHCSESGKKGSGGIQKKVPFEQCNRSMAPLPVG